MTTESASDSVEGWEEGISEEERIQHELLFYSQGPVDGLYLTGERARDLFLHSRLPLTVLSQIWNLADVSNDNILSVEEFVLAMHLILKIKAGLPLPKSLPKHLVPKAVPVIELPDISKQEREAYQIVFSKVTQKEIDAIQGRKLLMESQLSMEELSRVWDLSDVNRNGKLDRHEWNVTCHLIRVLKQGVSLQGPVNVFQFIPPVSPDSYQARKHRVEEYNRHKNQLMTAKDKRKSQIASETRRLELLKKRFSLHKELYEASKSGSDICIPEEEFLLYKEKEENNIEKVEAIVYRLKKEHEKIRQETVKVILKEQGSLQEDAKLIKLEQEEVRQTLSTKHTKATKDPDPFHQLYELRKELRKRSTLSEGEEPEIHFPFQTSPFDKESLHTPVCGRTIFISPDPIVSSNKNSFQREEILKDLCNFGEGFIEKWSSTDSRVQLEEDYDSIFMSLNVPMEARSWSGIGWSEGSSDQKFQDLHQKLLDIKEDMQKLNEESDGQLLFRNPEDYLARQKAQEEEEKLEKIKHQRRFADRRSEHGDKDVTKRRSAAANVDDEAQRIAREYRAKRRSLNCDKKTDNSDRSYELPTAPTRVRRKVSLEKKKTEELKVKTENLDRFNPSSASSPRQTESSSAGDSQSPEPTSSHLSTSPTRPSTKRKAAPPPPCSNKSVSPPPSCPTKIPVPESQTQPSRPPRRKRKESDEKKPDDKKDLKSAGTGVYVNVEINKKGPDSKVTEIEIVTVADKTDGNVEHIPESNIDELILESGLTGSKLNGETEESLLDTIIKDIPSLKNDEKRLEQSNDPVIAANGKSDLEILQPENINGHTEGVIVPRKKKDIECEITPVNIQGARGKFHPPESTKIEFREVKPDVLRKDSDSDIEVEVVTTVDEHNLKYNDLENDDTAGYFDEIKAADFKRSDDLDTAFNKLISFQDTEKVKDTKDTISIKSDISDASSEAPPLPETAPPPFPVIEELELTKVPSVNEIDKFITQIESTQVVTDKTKSESAQLEREVSEIFEEKDSVQVKASITMAATFGEHPVSSKHEMSSPDASLSPLSPRSPEHPGSPISDLPASIFSMRVKSPVRDGDIRSPTRDLGGDNTGKLKVDFDGSKKDVRSDSDMSDNEEPGTGSFSPGVTNNQNIPMATTEGEFINVQLVSHSTKLHSPTSDNSGPDSAFEDMQSSLTSNDPLSNTIEEFVLEESVLPAKVDRVESTPRRRSIEDVTKEARKFQLALDGAKRKNGDILSPPGPKDFMTKAQQFAEFVEKPPKMTVKKKRDIQTADDLTDEKCLEMEAERRAVISSSKMRKKGIDRSQAVHETEQDNKTDQGPDPENSVNEWRSDVSKRSSISWEEKPDKVNLHISENEIEEADDSDKVSRESIANLNTTRKQWETFSKHKEDTTSSKPKQPQPVRHWEVKLPAPLKRVPAKPESKKEESDSDSEDEMADTENANESAIEREIRLAMEREEMLRKEQEERAKLQERYEASSVKILNKEPFESVEQNNNKPTYHEMTEADRGSELKQREEQIQLELFEQEEREMELRHDTNGFQESDQSSSEEDENANESIIDREIRIQQERERELEIRRKELEGVSMKSPGPDIQEAVNSEQEVEEVVTGKYQNVVASSPTPVSTPDDLSDMETPSTASPPPSEVRTRISYEDAIANSHHEGESLIARELREAREREEELAKQRQRLSGSLHDKSSLQPEKQAIPQTSEIHKPSYQKDVSPYKQGRRSSQDSLSSHSTEKSPVPNYVPPKAVRVGGFGSDRTEMPYRTPEIKEKKKVKKAETPIEREIRLTRERENEFRAQKGLPLLPHEKKDESNSEGEDEKEEKPQISATSYFRSPADPLEGSNSLRRLASSRLQHEIKQQSDLEKKYLAEGKIKSTSEEHVGLVKYTENIPAADVSTTPKRNFSITRKSVQEPVKKTSHQNGSPEPSEQHKTPKMPVSDAPKYSRSVSGSGGLTFSYRESKHKAESKIEQELREMREREEELRTRRAGEGIVSPREAENQSSPMGNSVMNKRSHFEQTS